MSSLYMLLLGLAVRFIHFATVRRHVVCRCTTMWSTRGLPDVRLRGLPLSRGRGRWSRQLRLDQRAHRACCTGVAATYGTAEDRENRVTFPAICGLNRGPGGRSATGQCAPFQESSGETTMKSIGFALGLAAGLGLAFAGTAIGADQDRRRRPAHRPERGLRRAAQERRRAGGRRHQRRRRHPRPEDRARPSATTSPIRSKACRSPTSSSATA